MRSARKKNSSGGKKTGSIKQKAERKEFGKKRKKNRNELRKKEN